MNKPCMSHTKTIKPIYLINYAEFLCQVELHVNPKLQGNFQRSITLFCYSREYIFLHPSMIPEHKIMSAVNCTGTHAPTTVTIIL